MTLQSGRIRLRTLLALTAALTLSLPAAAQDIPSEVLITPAGLAWISAEARLLGLYAASRPPALEGQLSALRAQMIATCLKEVARSGTCPESVTYDLLRPVLASLSDGHTTIMEDRSDLAYGLSLVDLQEGGRSVVRLGAVGGVPTPGQVLLRGDELLAVNGRPVQAARSAFAGMSGWVSLTVRRDGQVFTVPRARPAVRDQLPSAQPSLRWEAELPVVTYPNFDGPRNADVFSRFVESAVRSGARGLVVDLRENGGGRMDECVSAASLLAGDVEVHRRDWTGEVKVTKAVRGELMEPMITGGGWNTSRSLAARTVFPGHVALLVNARSGSCGELFATLSRQAGTRVRVYGERTAGAGNSFVIGETDKVRVAGGQVFDRQGRLLPAFVTPDVALPDDLTTLGTTGVDTLLDRALADLHEASATGDWPVRYKN